MIETAFPALGQLEEEGLRFIKAFKGLEDVADGLSNKIGVLEDETYVSWNWMQGIQRTFYHESRDRTVLFLVQKNSLHDDYFARLMSFVRTVLDIPGAPYIAAANLLRSQKRYCEKWGRGLQILKDQYGDEPRIWKEIDSLTVKMATKQGAKLE